MKIRFIHHNHKTTYAVEVDDNDTVVAFATAKCGPEDAFCRRTGRIKATGRLNSKKYRNDVKATGVAILFREFAEFVFDEDFK